MGANIPIRLVIEGPEGELWEEFFEQKMVKIGRGREGKSKKGVDLQIKDPKVERVHAVLHVRREDDVFIMPMGGGKTFIDGKKVGAKAKLKNLSQIEMGNTKITVFIGDSARETKLDKGWPPPELLNPPAETSSPNSFDNSVSPSNWGSSPPAGGGAFGGPGSSASDGAGSFGPGVSASGGSGAFGGSAPSASWGSSGGGGASSFGPESSPMGGGGPAGSVGTGPSGGTVHPAEGGAFGGGIPSSGGGESAGSQEEEFASVDSSDVLDESPLSGGGISDWREAFSGENYSSVGSGENRSEGGPEAPGGVASDGGPSEGGFSGGGSGAADRGEAEQAGGVGGSLGFGAEVGGVGGVPSGFSAPPQSSYAFYPQHVTPLGEVFGPWGPVPPPLPGQTYRAELQIVMEVFNRLNREYWIPGDPNLIK